MAIPLGKYSVPAQGAILYAQTLIQVDWQWLSLPLALVALTILFIVAVVIQPSTHGRRRRGKSFSLHVLWAGVLGESDPSPDTGYEDTSVQGLKEIRDRQERMDDEKRVEEVQIQMVKTNTGAWRLMEVP